MCIILNIQIVGHSDLIPRGNTILSPSALAVTYLVGGEEAEVKGRVGDDVSLGTLRGARHDLVSQPEWRTGLDMPVTRPLSSPLHVKV